MAVYTHGHRGGLGERDWNEPMKRIRVFCGSSPGNRPRYHRAAQEMAAELVRRNLGLVYGDGNVGLMGTRGRYPEDGWRGAGGHPGEPYGARGWAQPSYKTPCRAFHARAHGRDGLSVGCVRCDAGQHDFGRRGGSIARSTFRMTLHYPFCNDPEIWHRRNGLNLVQGASWVAGRRFSKKRGASSPKKNANFLHYPKRNERAKCLENQRKGV
jgi:hypothetical protein